MRVRTASSFTSALLGVVALAACGAPAAEKVAARESLCPATMQGAGDTKIPLSGLTIMRMAPDTGWKNLPSSGARDHKEWALSPASGVSYRAACEYGDEIIGVPVDSKFRRCVLERSTDPGVPVSTWCEVS